jgi:hypothetical protein
MHCNRCRDIGNSFGQMVKGITINKLKAFLRLAIDNLYFNILQKKEYNVDFLIFEKSDDIAGLWRFREDGYGVMSFTHINVSKYNYCFSDFPYPDDTVEFMHHKHIYDYTKAYIEKNKFFDRIRFDHQVVSVEGIFCCCFFYILVEI